METLEYRTEVPIKTRLTVHLVWVTKYRYNVWIGEIQKCCRSILIQDCDALEIKILKGVVSKDHVHMHIEFPPQLSISENLKQLKGRRTRILQKKFPSLKKRYWEKRFWAKGYGAFSTGNITEEMVQEYIDHHRNASNADKDNFFLEE